MTHPKDVEIGDIVVFKDEQTIQDNLDAGKGPVYTELTVSSVELLDSGKVQWAFYHFEGSPLVLVRKQVGAEFCYRLYFRPEDSPVGSRTVFEHEGFNFLFEDIVDDDFNRDVENAPMARTIEGDDADYHIKGESIFWTCTDDEMLYGVTEWQANSPVLNPHLMVVEKEKEGHESCLAFYQGCDISENEFEVWNQTEMEN